MRPNRIFWTSCSSLFNIVPHPEIDHFGFRNISPPIDSITSKLFVHHRLTTWTNDWVQFHFFFLSNFNLSANFVPYCLFNRRIFFNNKSDWSFNWNIVNFICFHWIRTFFCFFQTRCTQSIDEMILRISYSSGTHILLISRFFFCNCEIPISDSIVRIVNIVIHQIRYKLFKFIQTKSNCVSARQPISVTYFVPSVKP